MFSVTLSASYYGALEEITSMVRQLKVISRQYTA